MFEVTVCMIPSRGNAKEIDKLKDESTITLTRGENNSDHAKKKFIAHLCNYCKRIFGSAPDAIIYQQASSNKVNDESGGVYGNTYYKTFVFNYIILTWKS